jgi:hypothetical protein
MDYQHTVLALVRKQEKCLLVKHEGLIWYNNPICTVSLSVPGRIIWHE